VVVQCVSGWGSKTRVSESLSNCIQIFSFSSTTRVGSFQR
jgi:hypothetical protein